MKLKNVQCYPVDNVPDHLTNECIELAKSMVVVFEEISKGKEANIILGATTFLLASVVKSLVSDKLDEQKKAVQLAALALIKNVYFLNGIDFDKENKNKE